MSHSVVYLYAVFIQTAALNGNLVFKRVWIDYRPLGRPFNRIDSRRIIARNIINDYYRKSNPQWVAEVPETMDEQTEPDEAMTQTIRDMILFMEELPEQDCQALCQTELEGISIQEFAINAGISYTAAKSRVARAHYKLSDLLMNCCHYEFDKYGVVTDYHPIKCCCCNQHN